MNERFWRLMARIAARPAVCAWLIKRAKRRPYCPIWKNGKMYMERYWLFNPFPARGQKAGWCPFSIQLHHILLPDQDRHLHDHPWNFRTLILSGEYIDERQEPSTDWTAYTLRAPGTTASLRFGEYHRVYYVMAGGCWTVFITGPYRGTWGFLVDGVKVKYREYLGLDK